MATEGDVKAARTNNLRMDGSKKNRKRKKHQDNDEVLDELTHRKALTSHPPWTAEASKDELGDDAIDIISKEKWVTRVEVEWEAVKILGRRMNVADDKFMTLEDFTFEENKNISKELEGRQRAEFKMKGAITSLEC